MRRLLAVTALAALAACAKSAPPPAPSPSPGGRVGYVRMDDLVRKHPLYGQLAQYDANIAALNLKGIVPSALAAGPQLAREEAALNAQLDAAAKRTDALLAAKGRSYQERENAAIAAALAQAHAPAGPSVAAVRGRLESTAQQQVASVDSQAQRDLATYRQQLEAQDEAQAAAVQRTLAARADRTYRAKVDELTAKEAALSLKLANDDAAQRLTLRTRLSSLALDDADRQTANDQLAALDRKEADALAAQRNTDERQLDALKARLRAQIARETGTQVAPIHAKSVARYREREAEVRTAFSGTSGPLVAGASGGAVAAANLPPDVRARIEKVHADYLDAFRRDAKSTVDDFNRTRADLTRRYALLHGTDTAAAASAQAEIASIEKKRSDLYAEMVAQIGREVKSLALQRGITVVVSDVAAPAGGVDLTDDAMKDIETLHE
jgi:hypothetical protein